jgi:hypothetical protein
LNGRKIRKNEKETSKTNSETIASPPKATTSGGSQGTATAFIQEGQPDRDFCPFHMGISPLWKYSS